MLRSRIIPCLLIQNYGLVKTVNFKYDKYIGDPLNAVRIFNEKKADEIIILDINSTTKSIKPDLNFVKKLASECRMPLCYGGGIKSLDQAQSIFSLGVEKIALSSSAIENPNLVKEISNSVGSQSVVVVLDIKKKIFNYEIYTHNGKKSTGLDPVSFCKIIENKGAGEIVINSIDNDGKINGYDLKLINKIKNNVNIPITALGGCSGIDDINDLVERFKIIGCAAGSNFIYKGKLKGVLINYLNSSEKDKIFNK